MELIKKWRDKEYKVDNYLYENNDGLKVLHTLNKSSLDTYVSFIIKAGSYYEKDLNIPSGTSHFLEHLLGDENKIFKSNDDIDKFCFGNKNRPNIVFNLGTSYKYVFIYGYCNSKRENDLMKLTYSRIDYPIRNFEKLIEKQRKIIIAEMQSDKKPDKDPYLKLLNFALGNYSYNPDFNVIGKDEESVKSITSQDLTKLLRHQYSIENSILTIQSPTQFSNTIQGYIDKISKTLLRNNRTTITPIVEKVENVFDEGYFQNDEIKGVNASIFKFKELTDKRNYLDDTLTNLVSSLIGFVGFNELREKQHLVYSINWIWNGKYLFKNSIGSIEVSFTPENLVPAINGLYDLIHNKLIEFLDTKQGKRWFDNETSRYLYPHTISYQEDYTETRGLYILSDKEIFDINKAKKALTKVTIPMLKEYIKDYYINENFRFWFDSSYDIKKVKEAFHKTKYYGKYSNM